MVIINNCLQHVSYTTKSYQLDPIGYSIVFTRTQTCVNSVYFIAHFINGGSDLHGESFAEASVERVRVMNSVAETRGLVEAMWKRRARGSSAEATRKLMRKHCATSVQN